MITQPNDLIRGRERFREAHHRNDRQAPVSSFIQRARPRVEVLRLGAVEGDVAHALRPAKRIVHGQDR